MTARCPEDDKKKIRVSTVDEHKRNWLALVPSKWKSETGVEIVASKCNCVVPVPSNWKGMKLTLADVHVAHRLFDGAVLVVNCP